MHGEHKATPVRDEGRKCVLLIAAATLAARKLAQYDAGKRVAATMCAIADAVRWAEEYCESTTGGGKQNLIVRGATTRVNDFYKKGCQEKSPPSTGFELLSRDPAPL